MDVLIHNGLDWVIAIQGWGSWIASPMKFFTFLGYENFFFLVLPLIYWSIDAKLGLKVAFILTTSSYLNGMVKLLFAAPRPYWVSPRVKPFAAETSFGIPSGHAQNATAIWGMIARWVNKSWAWLVAFVLAFLIGFSRLYLGMHFPGDVLAGWLMGLVLLFAFVKFWDPVGAWLQTKTLNQQIAIAFLVSLLVVATGLLSSAHLAGYVFPAEWVDNALRAGSLPEPASFAGIFTSAGSLFGLAAGAAWIYSRGGYETSGSLEKRAIRYVMGLLGILVLWYGLGEIFPRGETLLPLLLRYVRYCLVGFWITAGAPWLFFHFKLVRSPKMWDAPLL